MTVRAPLSEVLADPGLTNPTLVETLFIVAHGGVEQKLTASRAGILLSNTGFTGSRGLLGYTGSFGYTGSVGFVGSGGFLGSIGYTGSKGYTGSVGFTGSIGYTGSRSTASGYTGSTGTIGFVGSRGYFGSRGYTGSAGTGGNTSQFSSTATNIAGGRAGNIPIQRITSGTAFISTGSVGSLLQYQTGNTATWISTSTLAVGYSDNSDLIYVTLLPATGRVGDQYLTMVSGTGYRGIGSQSNIIYNVTTNLLTVPKISITDTTNLISTTTNALVVAGGVGIRGSLNVYSTATISSITSATSTLTGALKVAGGVGIQGNLYVGGTIYGTISGSITSANTINGGTIGQLVYQRGTNNTDFIAAGTSGQLLMSQGAVAGGPVFVNTTTLQVGYAKNILLGSQGSIPYQLSASSTRFLSLGTPGYVLTVNAAGTAPEWKENTGGTGGGTVNTDIANNLAGGVSGVIPYQVFPSVTAFSEAGNVGDILTSGGTGVPIWKTPADIIVTNLSGGTAGSLVYQQAVDSTNFIGIGTADQVLVSNGSIPEWKTLTNPPAEYATTATNIKDGSQGQIPFQRDAGQTTFFGPGTKGQLLVSAGTTSTGPVFTNTASIIVGYSANIVNGTIGQLVYQSNPSTTAFIGPGTIGQILVSQGANAPQYTNTSSITVGYAANIRNGTAGQIPYQTGVSTTRFAGPGNSGDLLVSDGTNGPSYTSTTTIKVAYATLADSVRDGGNVPSILAIGTQTNSSFYPVFVNSNNATELPERIYSTSSFIINPGTGKVSIGTTSPRAMLDISNPIAGIVVDSDIHFGYSTANYYGYKIVNSNNPSVTYAGTFKIQKGSGAAWVDMLTITDGGDIGIVYTSAQSGAKLSVDGGGYFNGTVTATTLTGNIQGNAISSSQVTTALGFTPYSNTNPNVYISGNQNITITGAVTGSGTTSIATTLADSGVSANTYNNVTVNAKGIVTGGSNAAYITANQNQDTQLTSLGVGTAASTVAGEIRATNEITAYYSSDARLKENVTTIENALDKLKTLSGVMFDWKDDIIREKGGEDGYFVRKHDTGIIAQDVEKVLPEVVATRDDGFLAVRYEKLAGLIIQAIKELAGEVDEIKKRI